MGVLLHGAHTVRAQFEGFFDVYPDFTQWNGPHRNTLASHISLRYAGNHCTIVQKSINNSKETNYA